MRLKFTYKDFVLLIGIVVAAIITIATLFFRDSFVTYKPSAAKKIQAINKPAVAVYKASQIFVRR